MRPAFIEHRPLADHSEAVTTHYAIVVDGKEIKALKTQPEAAEWAKGKGYAPIHLARERHLQNRVVPEHWRRFS